MLIRLIKWLISALFWLQAFAAPVLFLGLIGFWIASKGGKYFAVAIVVSGIGVVAGIIVAEYIRRKIGLEAFFARLYGSNEVGKKVEKEMEDE
jgi:hypothetical protein